MCTPCERAAGEPVAFSYVGRLQRVHTGGRMRYPGRHDCWCGGSGGVLGLASLWVAAAAGPVEGQVVRLNLRNTSGYVADNAGEIYVVPGDEYPTTRDGITFGWTEASTAFVGRDRQNDVDPRLAGHWMGASGDPPGYAVLRVDLAGTYICRLGMGTNVELGDQFRVYVFDQDGAEQLEVGTHGLMPHEFIDAAGTSWATEEEWVRLNEGVEVEAAEYFEVRIGDNVGGYYGLLAHIAFEPVTSNPASPESVVAAAAGDIREGLVVFAGITGVAGGWLLCGAFGRRRSLWRA